MSEDYQRKVRFALVKVYQTLLETNHQRKKDDVNPTLGSEAQTELTVKKLTQNENG